MISFVADWLSLLRQSRVRDPANKPAEQGLDSLALRYQESHIRYDTCRAQHRHYGFDKQVSLRARIPAPEPLRNHSTQIIGNYNP